jgi:hypothetical protein
MAKPKLALIPAAQGSKFYSVLPSSGVGDFNFTRSGSATRINSQGLIESVANGVSRLNYPMIDGVVKGCPSHILEPQRTNLVTQSNNFTGWFKSGAITVTSNYGLSPTGENNSTLLSFSGANNRLYLNTGAAYTNDSVSIYVKGNNGETISFDKSASIGGAKLFTLTGGWDRLESSYDSLSSSRVNIVISTNGGATATNIEVFGIQNEQGSYATSYIPTNGGTVTRSAETANGSGDASTFNDSEGVLMAEISALSDDTTSKTISLTNGGQSNGIELFYFAGNSIYINLWSGGFSQGFLNYEIDIQNFNKVSYSYKLNDTALWINGFKVDTATSASMPIGLSELAFENGLNANDWYGKTKQIQYYDSALNDNELETLTSWVSFQDMAEGQLYTIE